MLVAAAALVCKRLPPAVARERSCGTLHVLACDRFTPAVQATATSCGRRRLAWCSRLLAMRPRSGELPQSPRPWPLTRPSPGSASTVVCSKVGVLGAAVGWRVGCWQGASAFTCLFAAV